MTDTPGEARWPGSGHNSAPKKPVIHPVAWTPPAADTAGWPAPLTPQVTVITLDDNSPEDVVVDREGRVYTGAIGGNIIRILLECFGAVDIRCVTMSLQFDGNNLSVLCQ